MDTLSYKTVSANTATADKKWVLVDAEGEVLGRLAAKIAMILRGKHKACFTPHADCGDNVIVINAEKVILTGKKLTDKVYIRHTTYPGGQRTQTPEVILKRYPERLIEKAVRGMLQKNRLGDAQFRNLKVVVGPDHKYEAQKPVSIDLNIIK